MILSVSRRTDIPAFYPQWFMNRVEAGFVYARNPFNANLISKIPLTPDIVDCIVFWTKNPAPLLPFLPRIREVYGDAFYFQYSINAYGREIEPAVPDLEKRVATFQQLSKECGKLRTIWRYDPIFFSEKYTLEFHVEAFAKLLEQLKDYTDTCVISFVDMYEKTKKNAKDYGIRALTVEEMNQIAEAFSKLAQGTGVVIKTCAEAIDLDKYGIQHNSCIDGDLIEKIVGWEIRAKDDKQREHCGCVECADIGQYNTCKHGCRYCYANFNVERVKTAVAEHDDNSPLLTGTVNEGCVVKPYAKGVSLKRKRIVPVAPVQQSLF